MLYVCALLWVHPLGSKNHATNVKTNTVVSDDSRELRLLTVSVVVRFLFTIITFTRNLMKIPHQSHRLDSLIFDDHRKAIYFLVRTMTESDRTLCFTGSRICIL